MSGQAFSEELEQAGAAYPPPACAGMAAPGATLARRFRHNAPLVAQLMAVRLDAPQTRARRRAGSEEGAAADGATGETLVRARRGACPSWAA